MTTSDVKPDVNFAAVAGYIIDGKWGWFVVDLRKLPGHRLPVRWTLADMDAIRTWFQYQDDYFDVAETIVDEYDGNNEYEDAIAELHKLAAGSEYGAVIGNISWWIMATDESPDEDEDYI
jgi:hypothetical protein